MMKSIQTYDSILPSQYRRIDMVQYKKDLKERAVEALSFRGSGDYKGYYKSIIRGKEEFKKKVEDMFKDIDNERV